MKSLIYIKDLMTLAFLSISPVKKNRKRTNGPQSRLNFSAVTQKETKIILSSHVSQSLRVLACDSPYQGSELDYTFSSAKYRGNSTIMVLLCVCVCVCVEERADLLNFCLPTFDFMCNFITS